MSNAKVLVVFYARSGVTERVASSLAHRLSADLEEINERRDRSGLLGAARSIVDAIVDRPAYLYAFKHDPSLYELVVIATPVWAHRIASPVRAWIRAYWTRLPHVAFLCTSYASGAESALQEMAQISGKTPVAQCQIATARNHRNGDDMRMLDVFVSKVLRKLVRIESLEWAC